MCVYRSAVQPEISTVGYPALMDSTGTPIRVTDADRDAVISRLRQAVGAGLLELEEFSERVDQALIATDQNALALVTHDLLPAVAPAAIEPTHTRRATSWILGVMGGGDRRGRWTVAERLRVFNVMGGADLDLREASISAKVTTITVVSIMGGSTIRVPDGIEVDLSGIALMGANKLRLSGQQPPKGSPVLVVRAYSIMGGTDVRGERLRRRDQRREQSRENRRENRRHSRG